MNKHIKILSISQNNKLIEFLDQNYFHKSVSNELQISGSWDLLILEHRQDIQNFTEMLRHFQQQNPLGKIIFIGSSQALQKEFSNSFADCFLKEPLCFELLSINISFWYKKIIQNKQAPYGIFNDELLLLQNLYNLYGNRVQLHGLKPSEDSINSFLVNFHCMNLIFFIQNFLQITKIDNINIQENIVLLQNILDYHQIKHSINLNVIELKHFGLDHIKLFLFIFNILILNSIGDKTDLSINVKTKNNIIFIHHNIFINEKEQFVYNKILQSLLKKEVVESTKFLISINIFK